MEPPSKTQIEPKLFHVSFMGTNCGLEFSGYLKEVIDRIPVGFTIDQVLMKRGPRDQEIRFYVLEETPNPLYEKQMSDYEFYLFEQEEKRKLNSQLKTLQKLQITIASDIAQVEWQLKGNKS